MQDKYGAFDGRFLGIDLVAGEPGQAATLPWLALTNLDRRDSLDAVRRLDPDDPLPGLLRMTSLAHELRHFHDFLLSPMGSLVVRSRYLAAANTVPLLEWLAKQEGTIPIPLGSWLKMPPAERDAYWRRAAKVLAAMGKQLPPPIALPYRPFERVLSSGVDGYTATKQAGEWDITVRRFAGDDVHNVFPMIAGQLARASYALGGVEIGGMQWYPAQILEANAITAQLQHIGMAFGKNVLGQVLSLLRHMDNPYGDVLTRVNALLATPAENGRMLSLPDITILCTYALLADYIGDHSYAQVVVRFCIIGAHLQRNEMLHGTDIRALYGEWDEVLADAGFIAEPTFETVRRSVDHDLEFLRILDSEMDGPWKSQSPRALETVCRQFLAARKALCESFLAEPERYVLPGAYLRMLPTLPRPAVRIKCGSERVESVICALVQAGWNEWKRSGEDVLVQPPSELLPGTGGFDIEALDLATYTLVGTEMLFADNPAVTDAGSEFLQAILGDEAHVIRVARPLEMLPRSVR
jgi:hypothetical protein